MKLTREYEYDDVLVLPRYSTVVHRDDVSLKTTLGNNLKLDLPIICSPMPSIVTVDLVSALGVCGGIGILHRFYDNPEQKLVDSKTLYEDSIPYGVAIGLNEPDNVIRQLLCEFAPSILCIDIANGYITSLHRFAEKVANYISKYDLHTELMTGNVVTSEGVHMLRGCGVTIARVGIGSGHLCTTRKNAGIGRPQLSAIEECSNANISIVADGGINSGGDIVKALAVGADAVMIGSMFGKCFESGHNGKIFGAASKELQENFYGTHKSIEGRTEDVEKTVSLHDMITDLTDNIRSGFTYVSASNLSELRAYAEFVAVN